MNVEEEDDDYDEDDDMGYNHDIQANVIHSENVRTGNENWSPTGKQYSVSSSDKDAYEENPDTSRDERLLRRARILAEEAANHLNH